MSVRAGGGWWCRGGPAGAGMPCDMLWCRRNPGDLDLARKCEAPPSCTTRIECEMACTCPLLTEGAAGSSPASLYSWCRGVHACVGASLFVSSLHHASTYKGCVCSAQGRLMKAGTVIASSSSSAPSSRYLSLALARAVGALRVTHALSLPRGSQRGSLPRLRIAKDMHALPQLPARHLAVLAHPLSLSCACHRFASVRAGCAVATANTGIQWRRLRE